MTGKHQLVLEYYHREAKLGQGIKRSLAIQQPQPR